ncbi:MAG: TonB-dependent receptor [Bacteroidetes bacterium]|nr:MAG: TonB-dependent receptor [Bacteroidota bacterium]
MKKLNIVLIVSLLVASISHGQDGSSGRMKNIPDSVRKNMPKIGTVSGILLDADGGKAVSYASIAVISVRDSAIVGGALSDENGRFSIDELPMGRLSLRITFIGYATLNLDPFILNPMQPEYDAGSIRLNASLARLKEVEVSAEKLDLINSLDKKVYNLDKNIVNTGGTITEAMQNIPSVTVDIDGNVALRGSENVTILIDGKPSGMLGADRKAVLNQIPASAVEQIEVITNPSAKYDASGMAGIINIKTKKEKMQGMNGTVSAGIGTNDKYNFSLGLNNRSSKVNLYTNYSFRHEKRSSTGDSYQLNFYPGRETYSFTNISSGNRKSDFHTGKLGADFYLNKNNTLGINASLTTRSGTDPDQNDYVFRDSEGNIYEQYQSTAMGNEKNDGADVNLDYRRTWTGSKRELSATAGYSSNQRSDKNENWSSTYAIGDIPYQKSDNENDYSSLILQADFMQPIAGIGKLEAGLKSTLRDIDNNQKLYSYDQASRVYLLNILKSDQFIYTEQVFGAYLMYTGNWKKLDYNAGLRAEQTLAEGDSKSAMTTFSNDYLSFFPSAFVKYNFSDQRELQLGYSRRVNRPETRSLNPYTDYSDSLFLRTGNPYIKPEFIQSYELAYSTPLGPVDMTATIYYRYTDNMISRFRTLDTATTVSTLSYVNFNSSENIGAELVLRYEYKRIGSVMGTANFYQNKIKAGNIESDLQSDSKQWNGRLNFNIKAGKSTSLQITANYMSPRVSPTSKFKGMSGVDAGIKQDLWKGKGSISLNVSDIFNTRNFRISHFDDFYLSEYTRTRESRVATVSLSYRFGKQDTNLFQRKKNQRSQQQSDGMDLIDY